MANHFKLDMTNRSTRITIFKDVSDNFAEEYREILSGGSNQETNATNEPMTPAMETVFSEIGKAKSEEAEISADADAKPKRKSPNTDNGELARKYAVYNYKKRLNRRSEQFRTDAYMNFKVPNVQFVTLTFDPRTFEGANDLDICHNAFKKFIQRIRYDYDNFVYVASFSRQKETNNWHYHMLCNFDTEVRNKYIQDKWSYGMVESSPITSNSELQSCISYCIDNMYEVAWNDLHAEKGYLKSKGLIKRVTYRSWKDDEADDAYFYLSQIINSTDKPLDQSSKTVTNLFDQEVMISKKISHKVFPELFDNAKVATLKKRNKKK